MSANISTLMEHISNTLVAPTEEQQIVELSEKFKTLSLSITQTMKNEVIVEMPSSITTVNRYLKGEIGKLSFGEKLYDLLLEKAQSKAVKAA